MTDDEDWVVNLSDYERRKLVDCLKRAENAPRVRLTGMTREEAMRYLSNIPYVPD